MSVGRRRSGTRGQSRDVWIRLPFWLRYLAAGSACVLLVAVVTAMLVWSAVRVAPLTLAVIAALLLTALLEPVTDAVCRLRLPRAVGALAGVLVLLAALAGPGVLLWQAVVPQLADLPSELRRGWERTRDWLVTGPLGIAPDRLDALEQQVADYVRDAVGNPATYAPTVVEVIGASLLALVLLFFLLKDGQKMADWLAARIPPRSRPRAVAAAGAGWQVLTGYVRGTVVIAAVDATGIGLALVLLGVPLALPLALLTFLAAFVPIIGATVAGALAVLVALAANGPVDALFTLAAVVGVQQLEGNLLQPLIMGRALRLHPAVVLVAVTAGALTGGVAGALIAVPLTAVLYKVARALADDRAGEGDPGGLG